MPTTQNKGLVSIIVPVYNTAPLLDRSIGSILKQTYTNWELLLINDGSTDDSLEICQQYEARDERIRVFSQANQGQSVARNVGLDQARGEFIAFLDSDDEFLPNTLEETIATFNKYPESLVVEFPVMWINKKETIPARLKEGYIAYEDLIASGTFSGKYLSIVCDKVFRASLFAELRFLPGVLFEDNLMIGQLIPLMTTGLRQIDRGGYVYHQEEYDEAKNIWTDKKTRSQIIVYGYLYQHLKQLDSRFLPMRLSVARLLVRCLFVNRKVSAYVELVKPYLKAVNLGEILFSSRVEIKFKLKLLLAKALIYR